MNELFKEFSADQRCVLKRAFSKLYRNDRSTVILRSFSEENGSIPLVKDGLLKLVTSWDSVVGVVADKDSSLFESYYRIVEGE